jgi:hypothetical protein
MIESANPPQEDHRNLCQRRAIPMRPLQREPGVQLPLELDRDPTFNAGIVGNRREEVIEALAALLLDALGKPMNTNDPGERDEPEDHR